MKNTRLQREWLPAIVKKYGIHTVADIGAGDLNWMSRMVWDVEYTAYDLVPRSTEVIEFDLVNQVAPQVDALLCLWVLNHFPVDQCISAIDNIRASGSKYLIMTDRPKWHREQPIQIQMDAIESLSLNNKGDTIKLIEL